MTAEVEEHLGALTDLLERLEECLSDEPNEELQSPCPTQWHTGLRSELRNLWRETSEPPPRSRVDHR